VLRFLFRRLLIFPLLLLVIYGSAVLLIMAAPGEGLESGDRELPPEVLAAKRIAYNYDQPWWQRYFWTWPKRLIWDGDLPAHQYEDWTVVEIMRAALPVSLQLGLAALSLAILLGIGGGAGSREPGAPATDPLAPLLAGHLSSISSSGSTGPMYLLSM